MLKVTLSVALLLAPLATRASITEFQRFTERLASLGQGSTTIDMQEHSAIGLVGLINSGMVANVENIIRARPQSKTIYVDSAGGDVISAIKLARLIRQHHIHLIVSGKCFSACANYVFTGSESKDVMPRSLVGMHGKRLTYNNKNGIALFSVKVGEEEELAKLSGDKSVIHRQAEIRQVETNFFKDAGFSESYINAFEDYEAKWNNLADSVNCPDLKLWVMSKNDLAAMGIRGMGSFWEPASVSDAKATAAALGVAPEAVFYGNINEFRKSFLQNSLGDRLKKIFHLLHVH